SRGDEPLEPADVGLRNLGIALHGEYERDVDRLARGDHVLARRQPGARPRNLHGQIRTIDYRMQPIRLGGRGFGVVSVNGVHLYGDEAVDVRGGTPLGRGPLGIRMGVASGRYTTKAFVINLAERIARIGDVARGERKEYLLRIGGLAKRLSE